MKHSSTRAFYAYWNERRGRSAAPDRSELAPEGVRDLLGDIFVLGYERAEGFPFRVAGTRLCAYLGADAKGIGFTSLFTTGSRADIDDVVCVVAEEMQPAVAGLSARGADGSVVPLELLLLPFAPRLHTPLSLTGLLAPLVPATGRMTDFDLVSWRFVAAQEAGPRPVRRWNAVRGFVVYEGLR
jgi:hypothetical protein